jgi:hypothetical protein
LFTMLLIPSIRYFEIFAAEGPDRIHIFQILLPHSLLT